MNFNFNETAGASQSNFKQTLEGNKIHEVEFKGCEIRDMEGKKEPGVIYKVLDIKFENKDGVFTHTFFEPTEKDAEQRESVYGKNPSNIQVMMLTFKHLIDAVNPELSKEIDAGSKTIGAASWDGLRKLMIENTKSGIGKKLKIKLMKNKKGEAIFPAFPASFSREGNLYMRTNFIGENIFFSTKELDQIKKMESAKPTDPTTVDPFSLDSTPKEVKDPFAIEPAPEVNTEDTDLEFNL